MGTITATSLIAKASLLLQDVANDRYTLAELFGWLNEGQRAVVGIKPDAFTKNVSVQLVPGAKQTIPADAIVLIDIPRNMGAAGVTPGRSLRRVDRRFLDAQLPSWTSGAPSAEAIHFCYLPMDARVFYVYPPQPAAPAYVEMEYTPIIADLASTASVIALDDNYGGPLLDWIMYRALLKDIDSATSTALAATRYASFSAALGQYQTSENAAASQKPGA